MKKTLLILGLLLLGIALFVYVVHDTGLNNILNILLRVTFFQMLLYFCLSLGNFCLYVLRWWLVLYSHGHKVPFIKLFFYRMVGYSVSYLTPFAQAGGEPFRIYFLNDQHNVDLKESTSSVVIDKVFELSALVFFIICGFVYVLVKGFLPPQMEIVIFIFLFGSLYLLFLFYRKTLDGSGFFSSIFKLLRFHKIKKIAHLEEKIIHTEHFIAKFFQDSPKYILPCCVTLSVLMVSTIILEHWLLAKFLGVTLSFSQAFLVSTLPSISYIIPIPGGFGVLEGMHSYLFAFLGYPTFVAVALVLLMRMRDLFFVFIGLIYSVVYGCLALFKNGGGVQEIKRIIRGQHEIFSSKDTS